MLLHSIAATEIGCVVVRTRETGFAVGTLVDSSDGATLGSAVGAFVVNGSTRGLSVGALVGFSDGATVGAVVVKGSLRGTLGIPGKDPKENGAYVGFSGCPGRTSAIVGADVGTLVGAVVGLLVVEVPVFGLAVGALFKGAVIGLFVVGVEVGPLDGAAFGAFVGLDVSACRSPASSNQSSLASCPR